MKLMYLPLALLYLPLQQPLLYLKIAARVRGTPIPLLRALLSLFRLLYLPTSRRMSVRGQPV